MSRARTAAVKLARQKTDEMETRLLGLSQDHDWLDHESRGLRLVIELTHVLATFLQELEVDLKDRE